MSKAVSSPTEAPTFENEAKFQAAVVELALHNYWMSYHTHDSRRSDAGFPDLVLVNADLSVVLFRELKMPGKLPSKAQLCWLTVLHNVGMDAKTWWPIDWPEIERTLTAPRVPYGQQREGLDAR